MNEQRLYVDLRRDEGEKNRPYRDTVGKWTIGVGRNLDDVGLRADEMALMLKNDVANAVYHLDTNFPWWRQMTDARQNALVNMCFNMGIARLKGFKNMLALLMNGDYDEAADEAHKYKWPTQLCSSADRIDAI